MRMIRQPTRRPGRRLASHFREEVPMTPRPTTPGLLRRFAACDRGATAIEYGLIAAIVGVGIIVSLSTLRNGVISLYDAASTGLAGR
jgi:pilus assembly protein Flp/PilA